MLKSSVSQILSLFLIVALIAEITSIIWAGQIWGVLSTLGLLLASGIAGVCLLRSAGRDGLAVLTRRGPAGLKPEDFHDRLLGQVTSGVLFLVPGFFSDLLGLLVLLPMVRRWVFSTLAIRSQSWPAHGNWPPSRGLIIDGESIEIVASPDDQQPPSAPTSH